MKKKSLIFSKETIAKFHKNELSMINGQGPNTYSCEETCSPYCHTENDCGHKFTIEGVFNCSNDCNYPNTISQCGNIGMP
ncbi:MAG: class I lanthipeptide [Hyphomicrobiales bacterium]